MKPSTPPSVVLVHGGAGRWPDADPDRVLAGLQVAVSRGLDILNGEGTAVDAAVEATVSLEDDPQFNAGTGSLLNADGVVEMDAGVMSGPDLRAAGVGALAGVRNPIRVARRLLDEGRHVLLVGEGALRFARHGGFPAYDPVTPARRRQWRLAIEGDPADAMGDTVGAVVLDRGRAQLAAAGSTGGTWLKLPGRVGDTAVAGAGFYATGCGACAATGRGELMLRYLSAKAVCERIAEGDAPQEAVDRVCESMARELGSNEVGLIALDIRGRIGVGHGTPAMPHAWGQAGGEFRAHMVRTGP